MKLRTAVLPSLAALALGAPVTASAATLGVNKKCYGPGEEIAFSGGGYTPSSPVAIGVGDRRLVVTTADAVGEIAASTRAPIVEGKRRTYTATDQANPALTADVPVQLTSLNVEVTPKNGNPTKAKRVVAHGFTTGEVLWAHVRRGKAVRNVKVGRLKGACKTLDVKRRLFLANAKDGLYDVSFDAKRRYSAKTRPRVSFEVTVFRAFKVAGASSSESWIRIG